MNLPNKITVFRIAITPFYLFFFFASRWSGLHPFVSVIVLWGIWGLIELSDILDGYYARKLDLVTNLGKVMDPFADVLSRVTYFLCFAYGGIMPVWIFAVILYRELAMTFLRMVMIQRGTVVAASIWGKLKAISYASSGVAGLIIITSRQISVLAPFLDHIANLGLIVFFIAAFSSVASFITYFIPILASFSGES